MSTKENNFVNRKRLGTTQRFGLNKRVLAGILAVMFGASFVFTGSTSAHNIDLAKARETARDFARVIRQQSNGNYLHYSTKCGRMYPGHNHLVRCTIEYQNAKDTAAGVYTCKEEIVVYYDSHTKSGDTQAFEVYIRHTSRNPCGARQPGVAYV